MREGVAIFSEGKAGVVIVPAFTNVFFEYDGNPTNSELMMALVVDGEVETLSWKPLVADENVEVILSGGAAWAVPVFNKFMPYTEVALSVRVVNAEYDIDEKLVVRARVNSDPIPVGEQEAIKAKWAEIAKGLRHAR